MSKTIRKMKKADLLACVEMTLDFLCLDDIESPEHLLEELEVEASASGRILNKALEGVDAKERRNKAVNKRNKNATFRRNWIINRATALYCDDSNELDKINSVRLAAQEFKNKHGGKKLKPRTLEGYRNNLSDCTDQAKDKNYVR